MKHSKKAISVEQLKKNQAFLCCPICHEGLVVKDDHVECKNRHTFNISRKGYINFVQRKIDDLYTESLFRSRKRLLKFGLFDEIIQEVALSISKFQPNDVYLIDVGCGDGYLLSEVVNKLENNDQFNVGIDLSKDAISLATNENEKISWFVADLVNIPVIKNTFNVLLNIFTPANYTEFCRVLNKEGVLIKIIPNQNHFVELRQALKIKEFDQDNIVLSEKVLREKFDIVSKSSITNKKNIPEDMIFDLIHMSPMSRSVENDEIALSEITVDAIVYVCKKKAII